MTVFGASWALSLYDLTPLAKLIAIRLGDGCDIEGRGIASISELAEWCCASAIETLEALQLLALHEDVSWYVEDGNRLFYGLPTQAKPTRQSKPIQTNAVGTIYIMRGRIGLKVGITRCLERRVEGLRSAMLDDGIVAEWSTSESLDIVRRIERRAHEKLAAKLIRNEWFDVTLEQAKAAVILAIDEIKQEIK